MNKSNEAQRLSERIERFARQLQIAAGSVAESDLQHLLRDLGALTGLAGNQADSEPVALTDERIDYTADMVARGMPDGIRGFCVTWGWQQFARALLADCAGRYATPQPLQAGWQWVPVEPTPAMIKAAHNCLLPTSKKWHAVIKEKWSAMLSAAPNPPHEGGV